MTSRRTSSETRDQGWLTDSNFVLGMAKQNSNSLENKK